MIFADKYNENIPDAQRTRDPKLRDKDYFLQVAKSCYNKFLTDNAGLNYTQVQRFKELRSYANGKQDILKFKSNYSSATDPNQNPNVITPNSVDTVGGLGHPKEFKRKGFVNIFWQVISKAPRIVDALLGVYEGLIYKTRANAVDAFHGTELEKEKFKLLAIKDNLAFMQQYMANMGVNPSQDVELPESMQELETMEELGGFKPYTTIALELLIDDVQRFNDNKELRRMWLKDMMTLNYAAARKVYDDNDNYFRYEYIDPEFVGIQSSNYADYRDSEWAYVLNEVSIGSLREKGIPKEELQKIAGNYQGILGNPRNFDQLNEMRNVEDPSMGYKYDFFKVWVMNLEFIEVDDVPYKENKYGIRKKYGCNWVLGSDIVYEYGERFNLRKDKRNVLLDIVVARGQVDSSIVERMIPILDNFFSIWIKYQQFLSTAIPAGYIIDIDALTSIKMDGKGIKEADVLKRFLQTGLGFARRNNALKRPGDNAKLYEHHPGTFNDGIQQIMSAFTLNMTLMEEVTGLTAMVIGGQPSNAPVGTMQISAASTNNSLKNINNAVNSIIERLADVTVLETQYRLKTNDTQFKERLMSVMGEQNVNILTIAEKNMAEYSIYLEQMITENEWQEIEKEIQEGLSTNKDGIPQLTPADAFAIRSIYRSGGSLKLAETMLLRARNKNIKEQQQRAIELTQAQAQAETKRDWDKLQMDIYKQDNDTRNAILKSYADAIFKAEIESPDQQAREERMKEIDARFQFMMANMQQQNQQQQQQAQ